MPFTETLASTAWPLCSRMVDQTYGLSLKAATLNEATPSMFNMVKLTPAPDDPITDQKTEDHPPPIVIDGEAEWEVEEILDSHWHWRQFQYLIK